MVGDTNCNKNNQHKLHSVVTPAKTSPSYTKLSYSMNQKLIPGQSENNHALLKGYANYPKPIGPIPGARATPHGLLLSSGLVIKKNRV